MTAKTHRARVDGENALSLRRPAAFFDRERVLHLKLGQPPRRLPFSLGLAAPALTYLRFCVRVRGSKREREGVGAGLGGRLIEKVTMRIFSIVCVS